MVDQRLFVQRHADAPDHAAQDLAARGLGVQDTPGGNRADDARDANHAKLLVHLHLGKDCCVSVVRTRGVIGGICSFFLLDAIYANPAAWRPRSKPIAMGRACSPTCRPRARPRRVLRWQVGNSASAWPDAAARRESPRQSSRSRSTLKPQSTIRLRPAIAEGSKFAKLDADIVERQPKHVGRDLRHDGVGAGADIGGCAGDLRMAIGGQHDAHSDRHLQCFPHAGRHAPADQLAAVAHRARLGIALVPAERLGALAVAFAQRLAAVRPIVVLIALRITPQAKLERIELERDRKLVHRGFERKDGGGGAWRAHVAWGRKIEPRELVRVFRIGGFVQQARTSPSPAG